MGFFRISFSKSRSSASFWAAVLGEVSFDFEFLIDFHIGRNSIRRPSGTFRKTVTHFIFLRFPPFFVSLFWRYVPWCIPPPWIHALPVPANHYRIIMHQVEVLATGVSCARYGIPCSICDPSPVESLLGCGPFSPSERTIDARLSPSQPRSSTTRSSLISGRPELHFLYCQGGGYT